MKEVALMRTNPMTWLVLLVVVMVVVERIGRYERQRDR
jgi:hypothetical protein